MMKRLAALLFLLCPSVLFAQTVKLPAELHGLPGMPVQIIAEADGKNVVWFTPDAGGVLIDGGFFNGDSKRGLFFGPTGIYRIWAVTAKGDVVSPKAECKVTIGDPVPPPPPPPPPGPVTVPALLMQTGNQAVVALGQLGLVGVLNGDGSQPVTDQKPVAGTQLPRGSVVTLTTGTPPTPAPIPAPGLRVLLIEESSQRGKLTSGQSTALFSQTFHDRLRAKVAKDSDNPQGAFRVWDVDTDVSGESAPWKTVWAKKPTDKSKLPWLIISNPDKGGGYEGVLPATIEETQALLTKFGG